MTPLTPRRLAGSRFAPALGLALALALLTTPFAISAGSTPEVRPDQSLPFFQEVQAFVSSDRTNPPPKRSILFIGSSSIRLWSTLAQDFPKHRVINRGFGGSQIVDSIRYFDQIVTPYKPRLIVMYAGGNDINAGRSAQGVFEDYQTFAGLVHKALPRTRVAYISIAPNPARWAQVDRVREANRLIAEYSQHDSKLKFIDVFPHMLGPDGTPKPDIYRDDRLHMNAKGYALWQGLIRPYLDP